MPRQGAKPARHVNMACVILIRLCVLLVFSVHRRISLHPLIESFSGTFKHECRCFALFDLGYWRNITARPLHVQAHVNMELHTSTMSYTMFNL